MAITQQEAAILIRYVNGSLIVRQLQAVLKAEGQPTSGLKQPLQKRLTTYIESIVSRGDTQAFQRVKNLVHHNEVPGSSASPARSVSRGVTHAANAFTASPPGRPALPPHAYGHTGAPIRIFWKESPFYTILAPLSDQAKCPVTTVVSLSQNQVNQLTNDLSYRCMVYCAAVEQFSPFVRNTEIAFPHQVELRVNETVVAGPGLNLRGLKNKPGSTRPADITDRLNLTPNYRNQIGLTYAMTQKEFAFVVNLVKFETVENLVLKLRQGNAIAKETVISDMIKKNEDSDLVATSAIMSLKCPISTLRIDLPVRSSFCAHSQCFDATSFLQLQLQAPTWTCPTCNRSIMFTQLVVDRYFDDILNSTPKTVESVTINSEGKWSVAAEASNSPIASSDDEGGHYDSKIVDLDDIHPRRSYQPSATTTPAGSNSRDESFTNSANGRNGGMGNKRPIAQVIDLTLSDDDDEPPRPAKRTATSNGNNSSDNSLPTPSSVVGYMRSCSDSTAPNGYSPVGTPPYNINYPDLSNSGWYDEPF